MQEQHLFEYAVLRVVPHVEREEFINVGVILYCAKQRFLKTLYHVDAQRLKAICAKIDLEEIEANLHSFQRISNGEGGSGPIGQLDMPSRFRWLTATRSTVVQTSKVHPGFSKDAGRTLNRLYQELVLLP